MNIWRYNASVPQEPRGPSLPTTILPSCHSCPYALTTRTRHDAAVFYKHERPGPFGGGKIHRDCIIRGQAARSRSLLSAETVAHVQIISHRPSRIHPRQCRQKNPLMRPFNFLPDYAGSTHTRRLSSSWNLKSCRISDRPQLHCAARRRLQSVQLHNTANLFVLWSDGRLAIYSSHTVAATRRSYLPYLLTPCSRVLLEKLTGSQLAKKFPAFYGTLVSTKIHRPEIS